MPFILEGIATTRNPDGSVNIAPMGPIVESEQIGSLERFLLRPFQDSQTCRNLLETKQGVFHLTDDVLLFAQAVTKKLNADLLPLESAKQVDGVVIGSACQWYEFRIVSSDTSSARAELEAEVVLKKTARDFIGFNRARHAVIETAILATRLHLLEPEYIAVELRRFQIVMGKTAGEVENEAFRLLCKFIDESRPECGIETGASKTFLPNGESK